MLHHFFIPHKKKNKHKKAHLLSPKALCIYILIFILMQVVFTALRNVQPGVLGTTSAITRQQIIDLTNKERQKYGISDLKENSSLDKAAEDKAKNMFAENYWAHNSPAGNTPWVWIKNEGYDYLYAGENLARGYYSSNDVVKAWMDSKLGHKENLLGENYKEIGIAVEDGVLNGQKTTLVVQMFGTWYTEIADKPDIGDNGQKSLPLGDIASNIPRTESLINTQDVNSVNTEKAPQNSFLSKYITIDPFASTRGFIVFIIFLLALLTIVDVLIIWRKKALVKLHIRHFPHMTIIITATFILLIIKAGSII